MSNETNSFLPSPASLPTLVEQFRQRYPMGALVSELLTVHQNDYVVRASVQMGGVIYATGMAAANTIEVAEDRAKERVLKVLGLDDHSQAPRFDLGMRSLPPIPPSPASLTPPEVAPTPDLSRSIPLSSPSPVLPPLPDTPSVSELPPVETPKQAIAPPPELDLDSFPPLDVLQPSEQQPLEASTSALTLDEEFGERSLSVDVPSFLENSAPLLLEDPPEPAPAKKTKPAKAPKAEAPKPTAEAPEPQDSQDYSDIIAKIDVEMMRLGWNASKGREHLKTVYGKRSRQQLSYAELLDFLAHLESQAS